MKEIYPDLPHWEFELYEVSANVYEMVDRDGLGHRVSSKGLDIDEVIEQCKKRCCGNRNCFWNSQHMS